MNSRQPTRRRERLKSARDAQWSLSAHDQVANLFRIAYPEPAIPSARALRVSKALGLARDLPNTAAAIARVNTGWHQGMPNVDSSRRGVHFRAAVPVGLFDPELPAGVRDEKGLALDQRGQEPANRPAAPRERKHACAAPRAQRNENCRRGPRRIRRQGVDATARNDDLDRLGEQIDAGVEAGFPPRTNSAFFAALSAASDDGTASPACSPVGRTAPWVERNRCSYAHTTAKIGRSRKQAGGRVGIFVGRNIFCHIIVVCFQRIRG